MKSKKMLFKTLKDEFELTVNLHSGIITDETYGKKSMIYVRWESLEERVASEKRLIDIGFDVQKRYWAGSSVSEIQVSYFKGRHWNE